jgi:hypothetical protein
MFVAEAVAAGVFGMIVGLLVGLWVGRRKVTRLLGGDSEMETSLRETVVPVVEMRARELGVVFVSIPPPDVSSPLPNPAATVAHLQLLCRGIHEREQANSMALSDTVQITRSDVAHLAKVESK